MGKSTFCSTLIQHCQNIGRSVHLLNLDPAATSFEIEPVKDIRDLCSLEEVMQELDLGPNGGLIYCMEYLLDNLDWLEEDLSCYDNDFLLVDCPGQIELYTHYPIMQQLVKFFDQQLGYRCVAAYLMEGQFVQDHSKFFAGTLTALATMVQLEIPHINILTKMDLYLQLHKEHQQLDDEEAEDLFIEQELGRFLDPDPTLLASKAAAVKSKHERLNAAVADLIDEFGIVSFIPLNINREESIGRILLHIDTAVQYAENVEPKLKESREEEEEEDEE